MCHVNYPYSVKSVAHTRWFIWKCCMWKNNFCVLMCIFSSRRAWSIDQCCWNASIMFLYFTINWLLRAITKILDFWALWVYLKMWFNFDMMLYFCIHVFFPMPFFHIRDMIVISCRFLIQKHENINDHHDSSRSEVNLDLREIPLMMF